MTKDCHYLVGRRCARGLHADRRIGPGACERCNQFEPEDASKPRPVIVRRSNRVGLCRERLLEEWGLEWQARLTAAALASGPDTIFIPRHLYEEAMRHRR